MPDDARLAAERERTVPADVLARGADHHPDLPGLNDPPVIGAGPSMSL
jgi:hypothetical protein